MTILNEDLSLSTQYCHQQCHQKIHFVICYHRQGFELLQEDLSSTLLEKKSRKIPVGNKVYPTKRLKQTYAGRNVLIYVYIVIVIGLITYRFVMWNIR